MRNEPQCVKTNGLWKRCIKNSLYKRDEPTNCFNFFFVCCCVFRSFLLSRGFDFVLFLRIRSNCNNTAHNILMYLFFFCCWLGRRRLTHSGQVRGRGREEWVRVRCDGVRRICWCALHCIREKSRGDTRTDDCKCGVWNETKKTHAAFGISAQCECAYTDSQKKC